MSHLILASAVAAYLWILQISPVHTPASAIRLMPIRSGLNYCFKSVLVKIHLPLPVISNIRETTNMSVSPIPPVQIAAVIASSTSDTAKVGIKSNRPVPNPGKGEILVKLEFSGVCHSDLHSIRGDTPMLTDVAGHEGVGRVVKGKNYRCIALNAAQNSTYILK